MIDEIGGTSDYGYETPVRYELQRDQEDFLYKLLNLWDYKVDEPYFEWCELMQKIIDKGWYNDEEQFELNDIKQLYLDDLER